MKEIRLTLAFLVFVVCIHGTLQSQEVRDSIIIEEPCLGSGIIYIDDDVIRGFGCEEAENSEDATEFAKYVAGLDLYTRVIQLYFPEITHCIDSLMFVSCVHIDQPSETFSMYASDVIVEISRRELSQAIDSCIVKRARRIIEEEKFRPRMNEKEFRERAFEFLEQELKKFEQEQMKKENEEN